MTDKTASVQGESLLWIAGRDKPHRCPSCWSSQMRREPWWVRRWLPRHCDRCGAWTLTTWPRAAYGTAVAPRLGRKRPEAPHA